MNNIQSVKSIRNSRSFLLNALLIAFLFVINVSAFGNGVTNAGNTNARIADARERGDIIHNIPCVYVDFDNKLFLSTYFDQALEDRMIEGWTGKYESFLHLIPEKYHYWVIDGVDYSKPNKPE